MYIFKYFGVAVILAAIGLSTRATADSWLFAYTFASGDSITGSFNGTMVGDTITGPTAISASINGTPFVGSGALYESKLGWGGFGSSVISTDAHKNNFMFMDVQYPASCCLTNYFLMVGSNSSFVYDIAAYAGPAVGPDTALSDTSFGYAAGGAFSAGRWSLISAVPEPEAYAMLLAGLCLLGFACRRKRHQ
jgi:hypothetical protein